MTALIFRLLGTLMFVGTLGLLAIAAVVTAYALRSGRVWWLPWIGRGLAVWAVFYAIALAAGPVLTPRRAIAPGAEVAFCAFDCHLHVAVVRVRSDTDIVVTFRLRSDAKRAPEFPSHLRVRLIDANGTPHAARAGTFTDTVTAGGTLVRDLRFARRDAVTPAEIVVTWGDWQDYVVPGPENALVQRKRTLVLPAPELSAGP